MKEPTTILVSVALTSVENQPAYESGLEADNGACNLLSVGQVSEKALVDFVRKLCQTAQETSLLDGPDSPCLFAGSVSTHPV